MLWFLTGIFHLKIHILVFVFHILHFDLLDAILATLFVLNALNKYKVSYRGYTMIYTF